MMYLKSKNDQSLMKQFIILVNSDWALISRTIKGYQMSESLKVSDLRKKLGLPATVIIIFIAAVALFFLVFPGSKGWQIVVVKENGSVSHNCNCVYKTGSQGDGGSGYRWIPSITGKYCPPTNHPILKCPPK
jgi:hypothetical protein